MADTMAISGLISPDVFMIEPSEPVRTAKRLMEAQTLRSIVVAQNGRPVGVVKWRDIRVADNDMLVAELMSTDFPVLRSEMHVADAQGRIGDVDYDNIPVVDDDGMLIGEVPRSALIHHEAHVDSEARVSQDAAAATVADSGPSFDIQPDMDVIDAEGHKLGKVSDIVIDPSTQQLSHMIIEHGLLRKKHKRVPVDTVTRVEGDTVVLGITKTEFDFLADIEEMEE